jgi:hypothetical protein
MSVTEARAMQAGGEGDRGDDIAQALSSQAASMILSSSCKAGIRHAGHKHLYLYLKGCGLAVTGQGRVRSSLMRSTCE